MNGRRKLGDEDLVLFQELLKREKDRVATLLLPVSEEFEPTPNGSLSSANSALYGIPSGKKGYEFFPENNKNDYDWLKTPPATPLFPSLEMEANGGTQLAVQRELPIIHPLSRSRFAGNNEEASKSKSKASRGRPKSPIPKPKITSRSITPSYRQSIPSTATDQLILKNSTKTSIQPIITSCDPLNTTKRTNNYNIVGRSSSRTTTMSSSKPQNDQLVDNFLTSNLSKNLGTSATKTKPRSRGVSPSPSARSTNNVIPYQGMGLFSDETPPNLKTDRSTSATRGQQPVLQPNGGTAPKTTDRSTSATRARLQPTDSAAPKMTEPSPMKTRVRQSSCSPSVTRGRTVVVEVEPKKESKGSGTTQILGSRMVDKVISARKLISSSVEERDAKHKSRSFTSTNIGRTRHNYGN